MGLLADVAEVVQEFDSAQLDGCHLEEPSAGAQAEPGVLRVSGWVLARHSAVVAIEVVAGSTTLARTGSLHLRPDLAAPFPGHHGVDRAGFRLTVAGAWHETTRLEVRAVLGDRSRCLIGSVAVRGRSDDQGCPLVSVVIPSYEKAHFLPTAITSVLAQSYSNVEVIVVDDGSRDNTAAVAARYPGVRYVRQGNRGVSAARNAGLHESRGEFVVFLDADDMLLPDALRAGLACFEREPHLRLVTGTYRYVDGTGHFLPTPAQPHITGDYFAALLRSNFIGTPGTSIFRRLVFREVGDFDGRLAGAEDYELGLRIVRRDYPIHCHDVAVLGYRRASGHLSDDSCWMLEDTFRALRRQRRDAFANRRLRAAYSDGAEAWRRLYRPGVVDQICTSMEDHARRSALRGIWTLLRHDRTGLRDVVRHRRAHRAVRRVAG